MTVDQTEYFYGVGGTDSTFIKVFPTFAKTAVLLLTSLSAPQKTLGEAEVYGTMIPVEISGDGVARLQALSPCNHLACAVQVQHKPVK